MTNLKKGLAADKLCNQCLKGIHKECHQELGTLKNHPHGEAVCRGHYIRGQSNFFDIKKRHDEVVKELEKRDCKFDHDSPISISDVPFSYMMGNWFMEKINEQAIRGRCDSCEV